jgi:hypothetical protein
MKSMVSFGILTHDTILLILLVVIVAIVISQVLRLHDHAAKPLLLGAILGIVGALGYHKLQRISGSDTHIHIKKNYHCPLAATVNPNSNEGKSIEDDNNVKLDDAKLNKDGGKLNKEPIRLPNYRDSGLHPYFPTNFDFDQNKFNDMVVPDGWLSEVDDLKVSNSKYDIDGHLINGNTADPGKSPYSDYAWELQTKPSTVDAFTAADLHMSRKPREAFYFQSRWGVNSLRPWIAQELDDNANKIWWEENPDLEQYM